MFPFVDLVTHTPLCRGAKTLQEPCHSFPLCLYSIIKLQHLGLLYRN